MNKRPTKINTVFNEDPDQIMQLAISRGYSEDLSNGEREDILDEANWILSEQDPSTADRQRDETTEGLLQQTQRAS